MANKSKKPEQKKPLRPAQQQRHRPGIEAEMEPRPKPGDPHGPSMGRLQGRIALITGGDSGIGRAVAIAFAREGADVAVVYLNEHKDARQTQRFVEEAGRQCVLIAADIGDEAFCKDAARRVMRELGPIQVLVNNAAEQHPQESIEKISARQLERTFRTNIFAMFHMTKAVLPQMKEGDAIVNSTSVTAYRGSAHLIDYAATKGAIVAFTRSLSQAVVKRGIRVNAVAPGPIWTPLIPSTFPPEQVAEFGSDVPMSRAGEPEEVAPCYVFLASKESSYITGQVLHPNGGEIVNG